MVLAKIGLDGHDRGARVVGRALRDSGVEVIYLGPWAEIEEVVRAAVDEDVDVVGVSSLAYDHLLVPRLSAALREAGWDGSIVVGGIVPDEDGELLTETGVEAVFRPGDLLSDIVDAIHRIAASKQELLGA